MNCRIASLIHLSSGSILIKAHLSSDGILIKAHLSSDGILIKAHLSSDSILIKAHLSSDSVLLKAHLSSGSGVREPLLKHDECKGKRCHEQTVSCVSKHHSKEEGKRNDGVQSCMKDSEKVYVTISVLLDIHI